MDQRLSKVGAVQGCLGLLNLEWKARGLHFIWRLQIDGAEKSSGQRRGFVRLGLEICTFCHRKPGRVLAVTLNPKGPE